MGFLIRTAFWFSLVLLALPLNTGSDGAPSVGAVQAFMAAREAIGDISAICERKPDVCETGKSAMHTVGIRAREAARIAYEVLDENLGDTAPGTTEPAFAQDAATDTGTITGGIEAIIEEAEPKG
jgi:hypothetical protein